MTNPDTPRPVPRAHPLAKRDDVPNALSPACRNCRFWRRMGTQYGDCHRNPPTNEIAISVRPHEWNKDAIQAQVTYYPAGRWPNVDQDEWCGGHERGADL